jgi:signal transduction histidine kinase
MKFKILFFLFFFFLFNKQLVFSQQLSKIEFEEKIIKQKAIDFKVEVDFIKSQSFYLKKDWDSTLVYSMKQLSKKNSKTLLDYCHYFRGVSFYNKKLYKQAIKELFFVSNSFELIALKNYYLGVLFLELKEYHKALYYFKISEKIFIDLGESNNLENVYTGIGSVYIYLKQLDKAEVYLLRNLNLSKKTQNNDKICSSYTNLANLYYEQYKDDLAFFYFTKAYELSKSIKNNNKREIVSRNMAVFEENRGDFKKALGYRKESEQWKDSLNDQNKVWAIAEVEKKFAVKQKQKEVNVLQTENELKEAQRNSLLYSSVLLLLLLGASVYFYMQKTKQNKIILAQKEELDELNATKDKLFSIVSHDLRSSVNALKTSNAKLQESLVTKDFSALDQLLHNNSEIANGTYNLLDNLLNWALLQTKQAYFYIDSLHLLSIINQVVYNYKPLLLNKNISFENRVPASVFVSADQDSLKIIIRNVLDNAVKFSKENGAIAIYTRASEDGFCHLIIEDTGSGMSEAKRQELLKETVLLSKKGSDENIGTGLGMQLCKSLVHKNVGTLSIESQEGIGTKIIIRVPKIENNG